MVGFRVYFFYFQGEFLTQAFDLSLGATLSANCEESRKNIYKNLRQAATNPQNEPLDESGGTYMLGSSEQTRVYKINFSC